MKTDEEIDRGIDAYLDEDKLHSIDYWTRDKSLDPMRARQLTRLVRYLRKQVEERDAVIHDLRIDSDTYQMGWRDGRNAPPLVYVWDGGSEDDAISFLTSDLPREKVLEILGPGMMDTYSTGGRVLAVVAGNFDWLDGPRTVPLEEDLSWASFMRWRSWTNEWYPAKSLWDACPREFVRGIAKRLVASGYDLSSGSVPSFFAEYNRRYPEARVEIPAPTPY